MDRKILIRRTGNIISVCALVFIVYKLFSFKDQLFKNCMDLKGFLLMLAALLAYLVANFFLAFAWAGIIRIFTNKVCISSLVSIYAKSQIGKYIPGNIFHYVGRHMRTAEKGVPHDILLFSNFYEIGLLISGSIGMASILELIAVSDLTAPRSLIALIGLSGVFLAAFMVNPVFVKMPFFKHFIIPDVDFIVAGKIFLTVIYKYAGYAFFSGIAFAVIIFIMYTPASDITYWTICREAACFACVYIIASIAGFVILGAPGGIGIREAAIIALMALTGTGLTEALSLSAALLIRIVTVIGDLLFFLLYVYNKKIE